MVCVQNACSLLIIIARYYFHVASSRLISVIILERTMVRVKLLLITFCGIIIIFGLSLENKRKITLSFIFPPPSHTLSLFPLPRN